MSTDLTKRDDFDIGIDMSDMMMVIMMVVMASVLGNVSMQNTQATQTLQAQSFVGLTYSRTLEGKPGMQWENLITSPPYVPLVTVSFHNDGWTEGAAHYDWSVFISINNPDELHEIASGETFEVDMSGGARRIETVFYKTNRGERASVRVVGKY